MSECRICGKEICKEHNFFLPNGKPLKEFSGSSPPEIFVGRYGYPNVYIGVLSPQEHGETQILSSPQMWQKQRLPIPAILKLRQKLIYGRSVENIKIPSNKLTKTLQEVAMTEKSISAEFKLNKPIQTNEEIESKVPLISNAASVESIKLQENTKVNSKVDYLVNDTDAKSLTAMLELEKSGIDTSSIQKILSAGLIGQKINRKLVPTRWSITAVDDSLSKEKLKKIKLLPAINEIQLFHSEYLGNHYEFLLLPSAYSFEVIEISLKNKGIWRDVESIFPRKSYADEVTGAYYANRLALTEYLERIKRQALCIVFREIRPEYTAALGVGILRETSRQAFSNKPQICSDVQQAIKIIQERIKQPINNFLKHSFLLTNYGKQKNLSQYF
jgi:DNA repair protein NreA